MSFFYSLIQKAADGASATVKLPLTFIKAITVSGPITSTGGITATGTIKLNGIYITASTATPEASVTGLVKGHLCVDTATGNWYTFKGTVGANTGWKLVTVAT